METYPSPGCFARTTALRSVAAGDRARLLPRQRGEAMKEEAASRASWASFECVVNRRCW